MEGPSGEPKGVKKCGVRQKEVGLQWSATPPNGLAREGNPWVSSETGLRSEETSARTQSSGSVSLGTLIRTFRGAAPIGVANAVQFCSRQNCLVAQDKFDGIEFGQTKSARRARTMEDSR